MTLPPEASARLLRRAALPLLLLALLIVVQLRSETHTTTLLAQSIWNALHIPWSALLTLLLWQLTGLSTLSFRGRTLATLLLAFAAGAGTEWAQGFVAYRTPSLSDLLNNLLGAGLALAWVARQRLQPAVRVILGPVVLLIGLVASLLSPGLVLYTLAQQRAAFPLLFGSEYPVLRRLVQPDAPLLDRDPLRLQFDDRPYPGFAVIEQRQRWRHYSALQVTVNLDHERPIVLTAATHLAGDGVRGPTARVDRRLEPGQHQLLYPVSELVADPDATVERLLIYGRGRDNGAVLSLRRVELIR